PESMRLWLTGPKLNPETDMRVAVVDGAFRGYVDVDPDPEPIYWVDLRVPPSESDVVRAALLEWVEGRANERGGKLLRVFTASTDESTKRMVEDRGFRLVRHFYRMRIELEGDVPAPVWPNGVNVRSATPADLASVYRVHQETFEDSWEAPRQSFEEWEHFMLGEGFDPSLWFLVDSGDDITAVAICREHEGEAGLGWIRVLGVRRPWRRQGLGRALLLHAFREFQRRGFQAAALGVDASSLTGANRLYESAGMHVVRQSDVYEKTI
ncbi:MAG TPA: GNAT family N-acetyltransferase, partial [Gaiellaceae bacterium]|nr:GNAT family N-acetyltransferase [Gaiellaceae bacterium]